MYQGCRPRRCTTRCSATCSEDRAAVSWRQYDSPITDHDVGSLSTRWALLRRRCRRYLRAHHSRDPSKPTLRSTAIPKRQQALQAPSHRFSRPLGSSPPFSYGWSGRSTTTSADSRPVKSLPLRVSSVRPWRAAVAAICKSMRRGRGLRPRWRTRPASAP